MRGGPAVAEQEIKQDDERELLRALVSGPAVGVPQHADEGVRETFTERRMAQREAYGQFVADGDVFWPGTGILVFTTGMPVPTEHVEKWDLELAGVVHRIASPRLARAGARFPAGDGGQLAGDGDSEVPVLAQPTVTPPAPAGEAAAEADEGGTTEKSEKPAAKARSGSKASDAKTTDKTEQ